MYRYYTCYACHQPLCFQHSIEWHTGYTCDEFDRERDLNPDLASTYSQSFSNIEIFAIAIIAIGGALLVIGFLGKKFKYIRII